ncbi:hypothetical protein F4821DRAFT_249947 [Hypoxylon rubiginosum]|uniref:Uncharacterized protein n=1 Tax=Hypoxylon rubiginosum TaxID=110542 RepID=A0ACC0CL32_9PEZI|nr:hypothetical protein F4821DRAFT_249947 [Hypoxylon rubiginosum]
MGSFPDEKSTKAEMHARLTTDAKSSKSSRMRTSKPLLAILTLLSLAGAAFYFYRNGVPFYQTPTLSPSWNDKSERPIPKIPGPELPAPVEPFEPLKRYSLDYGKVACWQDGGVRIKELTPVEMSSLGIDRFRDTARALEQADEDAFCTRLRMHGASFWQLPPQWPEHVNWCDAMDDCVKPTKKLSLEVGFPTSGGVWMLDTSQGWEGLYPQSLGLRNALTMDERCEVIKGLGGHFCKNIQACPEMAALLRP